MPDPTVLEMINDKLKSVDEKLDRVISCQIDLKLQDEIIKAKVSNLELKQIQIEQSIEEHKKDMQQHYNPYYNETIPQKIWRKKPEIAAGGGLGALIVAIVTWILQYYNG